MLKTVDPKTYASFGELTVKDIIAELKKPGLDPRKPISNFEFANIFSIEEVTTGMVLPGIVTNLTRFGAFIDIGVKQDGLVHVSEISHKYITDPSEALKLGDHVQVKVLEVDTARKRIALSIKQTQEMPKQHGGRATFNNVKPTKSFGSSAKPFGQKNETTKASAESATMEDAMALLKRKFGK